MFKELTYHILPKMILFVNNNSFVKDASWGPAAPSSASFCCLSWPLTPLPEGHRQMVDSQHPGQPRPA